MWKRLDVSLKGMTLRVAHGEIERRERKGVRKREERKK
jgi:hypothetical protein